MRYINLHLHYNLHLHCEICYTCFRAIWMHRSNQSEQQRESDRILEQLTQHQAKLTQASDQIQLLEQHGIQATEEIEASSYCHLRLNS